MAVACVPGGGQGRPPGASGSGDWAGPGGPADSLAGATGWLRRGPATRLQGWPSRAESRSRDSRLGDSCDSGLTRAYGSVTRTCSAFCFAGMLAWQLKLKHTVTCEAQLHQAFQACTVLLATMDLSW